MHIRTCQLAVIRQYVIPDDLRINNEIIEIKSKKIPQGFLRSHSIGNYGWVFDGTILEGRAGYVTPK